MCIRDRLFHHGADGLFLVFRHTDAHFRQQLIHELILRDVADDFLFGTVVPIDALTVDRKGQISTLKETCHQPIDVYKRQGFRWYPACSGAGKPVP